MKIPVIRNFTVFSQSFGTLSHSLKQLFRIDKMTHLKYHQDAIYDL